MKAILPGKRRWLAGVSLILLTPMAVLADSTQNFNGPSKDTSYWGPDDINNNGVLSQSGGMLRYTCSAGTLDDYAEWPATSIRFPYNADWEMQLDCYNTSSPAGILNPVNSMGFTLESPLAAETDVYLEFYNSAIGGPARTGFNADMQVNDVDVGGGDSGGPQGNDGAIRFKWTAATELLTAYYDLDLSDGYQWVEMGTFGLGAGGGGNLSNGDWGMGPTDRFFFSLYGYSAFMSVPSGQMSADNFSETGGVAGGGTRPEPTGSFPFVFPKGNPLITRILSITGNYKGITPTATARSYDIDVAQDESGKLMAMGTMDGVLGPAGNPEVAGSIGAIKTVNEEPVARLKGAFTGTLDGQTATAKASATGPVEIIDLGGGAEGVAGTATYKGKIDGVPFSGKDVPTQIEAPPGAVDNLKEDWSLQLELAARMVKGKERIVADATLVLPDGDTIEFPEKAVKYNPATGYKLSFKKGTNTTANPDVIDTKTSITITGLKFVKNGDEWEVTGGTITYKFSGQSGTESLLPFLPPPPP
jgi:hypothetical protein